MNEANQAVAFDSYRFAKRLTETGFTEQQAEVFVDEQVRQVQFLNANLVTSENFAVVEADLKIEIANLRSEFIKWMVGIVFTAVALLGAYISWLLNWLVVRGINSEPGISP